MNQKIRTKKTYKICMSVAAVFMCCVLLLSGCAGSESVQEAADRASAEGSESAQVQEETDSGVEETGTMEPSPLIHVENPQEENVADMLQDAAAGVMVRVRVGDVVGSGVIWDRIGDMLTIVTAAHVFTMGNGVVEVTFADGWTTRVAGYEITDTDLMFLFVSLSEVPEEQLSQYYLVNLEEENSAGLQKDDGVVLMGSITGVAEEAYEGNVLEPWIYVEDFDEYMIVVSAETEEGMSGGGLFDYEGHFLGILCGKTENQEAVVLPQSVIRSLYGVF